MRALAFSLTLFFGATSSPGAQAPPSTAKGGRVFEMRTYYASPGKLEALHARFRDHTTKLFEKHGMTNVGYWVPIDRPDRRRERQHPRVHPGVSESRGAQEVVGRLQNDPAWKSGRRRRRRTESSSTKWIRCSSRRPIIPRSSNVWRT